MRYTVTQTNVYTAGGNTDEEKDACYSNLLADLLAGQENPDTVVGDAGSRTITVVQVREIEL